MMIQVTDGPSMTDPADIVRIYLLGVQGRTDAVPLIARGWRARLAVWLLRRYVRRCVGQEA